MFTERALKQFKCEWSLTVIYIYNKTDKIRY